MEMQTVTGLGGKSSCDKLFRIILVETLKLTCLNTVISFICHIIHIHIIPAGHVHSSCSLRNLMSAVGQFPFLFRGEADVFAMHMCLRARPVFSGLLWLLGYTMFEKK